MSLRVSIFFSQGYATLEAHHVDVIVYPWWKHIYNKVGWPKCNMFLWLLSYNKCLTRKNIRKIDFCGLSLYFLCGCGKKVQITYFLSVLLLWKLGDFGGIFGKDCYVCFIFTILLGELGTSSMIFFLFGSCLGFGTFHYYLADLVGEKLTYFVSVGRWLCRSGTRCRVF